MKIPSILTYLELHSGYRMLIHAKILKIQYIFGPWAMGHGPWALGLGPWAMGHGPWALGPPPPGRPDPPPFINRSGVTYRWGLVLLNLGKGSELWCS